jgi:rhamnosyltransferase
MGGTDRAMPDQTFDVVIPVYRPDDRLHQLLACLKRQKAAPQKILLVNTEERYFDPSCIRGIDQVEVIHISKEEFDHGGTRRMAAAQLSSEFLLFLTQDALPADEVLTTQLLAALADPKVCVAYARQLPAPDCNVLERYTRSFNYPPQSRVKTAEDLPKLGIKAFFCSNVCAMYRRSTYEALGGFTEHTIFNEDMIYAGRALKQGWAIAYCAQAQVVHSHNYSGLQQFHRNFDLGVSHAQYPDVFEGIRSESEGIRMVQQTAGYLIRVKKPYLLPKLIWQSGCKYLGYRLGKGYEKLPAWVIRKCTMNQNYWR